MSNDMKIIMESWKKNVTEVGLQDVGPGSYSATQMTGEDVVTAEWFADVLQEIIPFGNLPDIKPAYEEYLSVLDNNKSSSGDVAAAALAFIWRAGTTLLEFYPAGKATKEAVSLGFELAPKIAKASKKIVIKKLAYFVE